MSELPSIPAKANNDELWELSRTAMSRETRALWREHRKLELTATSLAAPISAIVVAMGVYLAGGSPLVWSAIGAGVLAAFIGTAVTLLLMYTYYSVVEAPRRLCQRSFQTIQVLQNALEQEQARNARARLVGDIICLDVKPNLDTTGIEVHHDCFLTLSVLVRNDSTAATMVSGFALDLLWQGEEYPGVREPIDGYHVQRYSREPAPWETKHKVRYDELIGFPYNQEITNTNHQTGWLRFSVGSVPLAAAKDGRLVDAVNVRLVALDSRRERHVIYEGTTKLASCGSITRIVKPLGPYA